MNETVRKVSFLFNEASMFPMMLQDVQNGNVAILLMSWNLSASKSHIFREDCHHVTQPEYPAKDIVV